MTTVNVYEAKTQLSKLLELVERGESVTIARAGKPVADLVPHVRADIVFGALAGRIRWNPDTFDDVDPEIIARFGAR
ncbi:MAG: type II toxin-antitoxin system prevent-host-death family antitoxin [Propionibacteriaceae bacterium]|nr:type II toxin-antitoxin system prevent-host-death family antitoxin [Propionibacteriaceae bacterium]